MPQFFLLNMLSHIVDAEAKVYPKITRAETLNFSEQEKKNKTKDCNTKHGDIVLAPL